MKIIHFSDLHLGIETYGALNPDTGLSTRLEDFLRALDQVVAYALSNEIGLVIFCGDAYESRNPSQTQQREFAKRIHQLSSSNIPVFLLVGNHDMPNAIGKAISTEIFDTLSIKNVYVAKHPDIHRIPTKSGIIQIAALPWIKRSNLLSKEENKNLTFEQLNERIQQILTNTINTYTQSLDPSLPAILAAHISVATARFGSERTAMLGREPVLLPSSIFNSAFDYIALGHIHKHQILTETPHAAYAGSLVRIDFSEEKEEKGFCVVEIRPAPTRERRSLTFTFQKVEGQRFLTIPIELKKQDLNPMSTILLILAKYNEEAKDAIVRLQISLPLQFEGMVQESVIRKALKEARHVLPLSLNITDREPRMRLGKWGEAENPSPHEALQAYLKSKSIPPDRTQVLLKYGERLIRELYSPS